MKELKTDEEKLRANMILFTLRCSTCNKSFKALVTMGTVERLDDRRMKNQVHKCSCGAGYVFTHAGWIKQFRRECIL